MQWRKKGNDLALDYRPFQMNTASAARTLMSDKASYLSHLRRAFLLRAHPDRFRSHPESLRKVQAAAIGAFQVRRMAYIYYL